MSSNKPRVQMISSKMSLHSAVALERDKMRSMMAGCLREIMEVPHVAPLLIKERAPCWLCTEIHRRNEAEDIGQTDAWVLNQRVQRIPHGLDGDATQKNT